MQRARSVGLAAPSLVLAGLLAACGHSEKPTTAPTTQQIHPIVLPVLAPGKPSLVYQEIQPGEQVKPDDSVRAIVDVVQITAPAGTISRDRELWEIVSDRTLSPEQQRLLQSNGIRLGLAEAGAWAKLKATLDRYPGVMSQTYNIRGGMRAEFDKTSAPAEDIFYLNRDGKLVGRSFDESENFWALQYAPQPGVSAVHVELCPMVRSARRYLQFSKGNTERELQFVQPESLYDIGVKLNVPAGMLLILSPTEEALTTRTSIGGTFLLKDEPAGRTEQLLVCYPRLYRLNVKATEDQNQRFLEQIPGSDAQPSKETGSEK